MNDPKLEALRAQVSQIMRENPAPKASASDRVIALFEDDLREAALRIVCEISFSELDEALGAICFNQQHEFYGRDYRLLWQESSANAPWSLYVLNQKSGGKRRLLDCPDSMKIALCPHLSLFGAKIEQILVNKN